MPREVLFEIKVTGAYAKVCALDAETGIEATIVAPAAGGEYLLKQAALRKLERELAKQSQRKQ